MKTDRPTADELRRLFSYEPSTGELRWLVRPHIRANVTPGDLAGCINGQGYRVIGLRRKLFNAHQIAWAVHFGEWAQAEIDHKNGFKSDNRIENLRQATCSQNHANVGMTRVNTSGKKGVTWSKKSQKWVAQIKVKGKNKYLGMFHSVDEAHAAYCAAANDNFGAYARTA